METYNPLLIAVDPGHGGEDSGAVWNSRMEKDDNLRFGQALRDALAGQGVDVLMLRDADISVPPPDRAAKADGSGADLLVSLHRRSVEQPGARPGVGGVVCLTAPDNTVGQLARSVLGGLEEAGVQANLGVSRGNSYLLRKTGIPALTLELGLMQNEEDSRLFDRNLSAYAEAAAKAILGYFGMGWKTPPPSEAPGEIPPKTAREEPVESPVRPGLPNADPAPAETGEIPRRVTLPPPAPSGGWLPRDKAVPREDRSKPSQLVQSGQQALNRHFGTGIPTDGLFGEDTEKALLRAIQMELNHTKNAGIAADGRFGAETWEALPTLRSGDAGNLVLLLQIALALAGYDAGDFGGLYDGKTRAAVQMFQRDNYLVPDGTAGSSVWRRLLG